ncbi:MAG: GntR family transcriptional regulator [Micrococcales bacterium]|nr:GntR family transcriptional regulator [Micrococcales bacterium]
MTTDDERGKTARVTREFRTRIEAGVWRDGEALPGTRTLAEQFGVSIATVNEAMKALATEGLVENRARSGRVVRSAHLVNIPVRRRPHVVLVGGYAGTGKTEFGRIMTRLTGWMHIDKDTITRPVVEAALEALGRPASDRESPTYLSQIRPREYEALIATAHDNVSCGAGAILTAPFLREYADPAWLARELNRFANEGANSTVVWVTCDIESMHTYLRGRGAARDNHKLEAWDEYLTSIDLDFRPPVNHVVIDNSASAEPLKTQAERLVSQIAEPA